MTWSKEYGRAFVELQGQLQGGSSRPSDWQSQLLTLVLIIDKNKNDAKYRDGSTPPQGDAKTISVEDNESINLDQATRHIKKKIGGWIVDNEDFKNEVMDQLKTNVATIEEAENHQTGKLISNAQDQVTSLMGCVDSVISCATEEFDKIKKQQKVQKLLRSNKDTKKEKEWEVPTHKHMITSLKALVGQRSKLSSMQKGLSGSKQELVLSIQCRTQEGSARDLAQTREAACLHQLCRQVEAIRLKRADIRKKIKGCKENLEELDSRFKSKPPDEFTKAGDDLIVLKRNSKALAKDIKGQFDASSRVKEDYRKLLKQLAAKLKARINDKTGKLPIEDSQQTSNAAYGSDKEDYISDETFCSDTQSDSSYEESDSSSQKMSAQRQDVPKAKSKNKNDGRKAQIKAARALLGECNDALSTLEKSYDVKAQEGDKSSLIGELAKRLDSFVKTDGGFHSERTKRPYKFFRARLNRLERLYQCRVSLEPMGEVKRPSSGKH
jgi:hypothetical protein